MAIQDMVASKKVSMKIIAAEIIVLGTSKSGRIYVNMLQTLTNTFYSYPAVFNSGHLFI